jgi:Na+-driven multidrug efflux pump
MASTVMNIATTVEAQGLNSIILGLSLASAVAWYVLVKECVSMFVKKSEGVQGAAIAALVTTLLAVIVYMLIKAFVKNVKLRDMDQPAFAVVA